MGNVASVPPVLKTLDLYNSITSLGGHHAGRGNILCQTLYVMEVWHMVTQFLVAVAYLFLDPELPVSEYGTWETILEGFRDIAFTSGWTRIIGHGIFINLLDELTLTSPGNASGGTSPASRQSGDSNDSVDSPLMEMQDLVLHNAAL